MIATPDGGGFLDSEGCHYDTIHSLVGIHEMGLCGCGYAEAIVELAHALLRIMKAKSDAIDDDLERRRLNGVMAELVPDSPTGEVIFHVMDHAGWIEHGTSIRWSWLTSEGEEALKTLDQHAPSNPFFDGLRMDQED